MAIFKPLLFPAIPYYPILTLKGLERIRGNWDTYGSGVSKGYGGEEGSGRDFLFPLLPHTNPHYPLPTLKRINLCSQTRQSW